MAHFPQIGTFTGAWSERDPASGAHGVWGNRIVLQGTAGTVVVANLDFRRTFGFPSHGFAVASVTADQRTPTGIRASLISWPT